MLLRSKWTTICSSYYTEILSQLGHDYELQADKSREPDCTQPGSEYYVCGRCKDVKLVRKPALGHDWGDWIVDQQETDQADVLTLKEMSLKMRLKNHLLTKLPLLKK